MHAANIAIIGNAGKYGRWLEQFFNHLISEGLVASVFGADVGTPETNLDVASRADVVVVAVPPRVTVGVIREITPVLRPGQLVMDITSLKVEPIRAMLESAAEVRGLHPMCAPPRLFNWRGQTVADCPVRLAQWREWSDAVLRWSGARLKVCSPEQHDHHMAVVQGLVHATELVMASVIRNMGVNVRESLGYTSPIYRIALSLIGRILKQNPELYADIQMLNPAVPVFLQAAAQELGRFQDIVEAGDQRQFTAGFLANREHFGAQVLQENFDLFELLNQLMVDHGSEDQVTLVVAPQQDQPGVLHQMTGAFLLEGVDLISLRTFRVGGDIRFEVVFDRSPQAPEVQRALTNIASQGLAVVR